uniref:USP domain-containing protein n=1 Tax=Arcella intermedia TaxID=1963864 RepID=A0A6B2KWG4_9EUKA
MMNLFGELKGFDEILRIIQANPYGWNCTKRVNFIKSSAKLFLYVVSSIFTKKSFKQYCDQFQAITFQYLLNLDEDELKNIVKTDIEQIVNDIQKFLKFAADSIYAGKITEQFILDFADKCFKSKNLEKKLNGLLFIEESIKLVEDKEREKTLQSHFVFKTTEVYHLKTAKWLEREYLTNWILERNVIEYIFDKKQTRDLLVKNCYKLVDFLSTSGMIGKYIDLIWDATEDKYLCSAVLDVLERAVRLFPPKVNESLWNKIKSIQPSLWTLERVKFAYTFCQHAQVSPTFSLGTNKCLSLLWHLCSDTSQTSPEVLEYSLDRVAHILSSSNVDSKYYARYIAHLENDENTGQTIRLLLKVFQYNEHHGSFSDDSDAEEEPLLFEMERRYCLLMVLITEFRRYKEKISSIFYREFPSPQSSDESLYMNYRYQRLTHKEGLECRLDLLNYVVTNLSDRRTITDTDFKDIWMILFKSYDLLFILNAERELCLDWFRKLLLHRRYHDQKPVLRRDAIQKIFYIWLARNYLPAEYSMKGFECLKTYFLHLNQEAFEMRGADFVVLSTHNWEGIKVIWEVALKAKSVDVFSEAHMFLLKLYTKLSDRILPEFNKLMIIFVNTCFDYLSQVSENWRSKKPAKGRGLLQCSRCLTLLTKFLDKTKTQPPLETVEPAWEEETLPQAPSEYHKQLVQQVMEVMSIGELEALLSLKRLNWSVDYAMQYLFEDRFREEIFAQAAALKEKLSKSDLKVVYQPPTAYLANSQSHFNLLLSLLDNPKIKKELVWNIINILPPNRELERRFQVLENPDWNVLLDSSSFSILLYSLQILDGLMNPKQSGESTKEWREKYLRLGGLDHILLLFLKQQSTEFLENSTYRSCLVYFLSFMLVYMKNYPQEMSSKLHPDFIHTLLKLVWYISNKDKDENIIIKKDNRSIVQYSMELLITVIINNPSMIEIVYNFQLVPFKNLVMFLISKCCDEMIRTTIANHLTKLCSTFQLPPESKIHHPTQYLFEYLVEEFPFSKSVKGFGQYFDLLVKLTDLMLLKENNRAILEPMMHKFIQEINLRPGDQSELKKDHDEVLTGCLRILHAFYTGNPNAKHTEYSQKLLKTLFEITVVLPEQVETQQRIICIHHSSRAHAFELLQLLAFSSPNNLSLLISLLDPLFNFIKEGKSGKTKSFFSSLRSVQSQRRGPYVGLANLGATCYANSVMQQFYMIPDLRIGLFSIKPPVEDQKTEPEVMKEDELKLVPKIQEMFWHLQESQSQYYDPSEFIKECSRLIDTGQQQDAEEFYTLLSERIEREISNTVYPKLLYKLFITKIQREIICSLDSTHVTEGIEEYHALGIEVKKMKNLSEALVGYFQGEKIQDFKCNKCNQAVEVTKAVSLMELPQNLIINLKRFEWNYIEMKKEKITDRFEFPMELDVKQYMSSKAQHFPNEYYLYQLCGVIVHTGSADSGHYYSIIKSRTSKETKWLKFDDKDVSHFNIKDLADETFGGDSFQFDSDGESLNDKNAFMLFYEREYDHHEWFKETEKLKISQAIPITMHQKIQASNVKLIRERLCMDSYFLTFAHNILQNYHIEHEIKELLPNDQILQVMKFGTYLMFEFSQLYRDAEQEKHFNEWSKVLLPLYNKHIPACRWLLYSLCTTQNQWLYYHLIVCPLLAVRMLFKNLLETCLLVLGKVEQSLYPTLFESWEKGSHSYRSCEVNAKVHSPGRGGALGGDNTISEVELPKEVVSAKFINHLVFLMEETRGITRSHNQYFGLLFFYSTLGEHERRLLHSFEIISALVDYYMGTFSPEWIKYPREDINNKDLTEFMALFSNSILVCRISASSETPSPFSLPPQLLLWKRDQEFLLKQIFFDSLISQCYDLPANIKICSHLAWESKQHTTYLLRILVPQSFRLDHRASEVLDVLERVLLLNDSLTKWRIAMAFNSIEGHGILHHLDYYQADYNSRGRLTDKFLLYYQFIWKLINQSQEISAWLKFNSRDFLRMLDFYFESYLYFSKFQGESGSSLTQAKALSKSLEAAIKNMVIPADKQYSDDYTIESLSSSL